MGSVLVALAVTGTFLARSRVPGPPKLRSVAVLPSRTFREIPSKSTSPTASADELITDLSKIESLRVISRTSMMRFKGTKESLPAIAKTLGVDAVVEGSVRRAGNQVRIAAKPSAPKASRAFGAKVTSAT